MHAPWGYPEACGPSPRWTGVVLRPVPPTTPTPPTGCRRGFFGPGCALHCSCGGGADCDPVSGQCLCVDGYTGPTCRQGESGSGRGREGDRVLVGSGEWHECHHLSAMPMVSAWPLLDKVWTFQPLDRGWDSAYSQPKSSRRGLKLQKVETPWAGLGDPVWVGADTAPRHPFLTLHV